MCRVCLKRPEIPDERYGRCEPCAKAGRIPYRFRLAKTVGGDLVVKAGEISPRVLHDKWQRSLDAFNQKPSSKPHLGLHETEMVIAKDRIESLRLAPDLSDQGEAVLAALRHAATRSDASW